MKLSVVTFLIGSASAFVPVTFKPTAFKSYPTAVGMSDMPDVVESETVQGGEPFLTDPSNKIAYTITVDNNLPSAIEVYFFKAPAKYSKVDGMFVNSLATKVIQGKGTSQCSFEYEASYAAAALNYKQQSGDLKTNMISYQPLKFGYVSDMMIDKNGDPYLMKQRPATEAESKKIPNGAFAVKVPKNRQFEPLLPNYHVGLGAISDGKEIISSFNQASPGTLIDIQPVVQFWVAIGSMEKNSVVNFTTLSVDAALCDATNGKRDFKVTRTDTGAWQVV